MQNLHCVDTSTAHGVQTVTRAHFVGNYVYDLMSVRACVCVNLRGAGVDILLLALRGKPPMVVVTARDNKLSGVSSG